MTLGKKEVCSGPYRDERIFFKVSNLGLDSEKYRCLVEIPAHISSSCRSNTCQSRSYQYLTKREAEQRKPGIVRRAKHTQRDQFFLLKFRRRDNYRYRAAFRAALKVVTWL